MCQVQVGCHFLRGTITFSPDGTLYIFVSHVQQMLYLEKWFCGSFMVLITKIGNYSKIQDTRTYGNVTYTLNYKNACQ